MPRCATLVLLFAVIIQLIVVFLGKPFDENAFRISEASVLGWFYIAPFNNFLGLGDEASPKLEKIDDNTFINTVVIGEGEPLVVIHGKFSDEFLPLKGSAVEWPSTPSNEG